MEAKRFIDCSLEEFEKERFEWCCHRENRATKSRFLARRSDESKMKRIEMESQLNHQREELEFIERLQRELEERRNGFNQIPISERIAAEIELLRSEMARKPNL
jgi:hypothetical protein